MNIQYSDTDTVVHTATKDLAVYITEHSDTPLLLMLSGGSALALLDGLSKDIFTSDITITTLDERYTFNPDESNFEQILLHPTIVAIKETVSFIDPRPTQNESFSETAKRFQRNIIAWNQTHPKGTIATTQGVGGDGHTAGIFPHPEDPDLFEKLFNVKEHLVTGYEVSPEKNPYTTRITTTLPFLRDYIDFSLLFITGESKKTTLQRVLNDPIDIPKTPAQIIREMQQVTIHTDIKI